jgi:hypothetical protein
MSEMTGAKGVFLFAGFTDVVMVKDTHSGVKQTIGGWLVQIEQFGRVNFAYRSFDNIFWTHQTKLDSFDLVNIIFRV